MKHRPLKQLCGLIATAAIALVLIGCNGKAGQNGTNGINGTNGTNGTSGTNGTNGAPGVVTINAAALTPEEWGNKSFSGSVQSVTIPTTGPNAGKPVVSFTVVDQFGTPVSGLSVLTTRATTAIVTSYANVAFSIAKLVPGTNGSPSKWVSYVVTSTPNSTTAAAPSKPSTDSVGTLVEPTAPDGSYTYTFYRNITAAQAFLDTYTPYSGNNTRADLGDVTYVNTLTHRVTVQIGGSARGTGSNTPDASSTGIVSVTPKNPANIIYDFVPSTGAVADPSTSRDIVNMDACNSCHTRLEVHGGSRVDPRYCIMCHTDQRKYGTAEATITGTNYTSSSTSKINGLAVGDFPAFIHRLHMGEGLQKTGYNYGGVLFNEVTYPQDQRNCVKCHTAAYAGTAALGDNWKNVPNRQACGACHDAVDFATGTNHGTAGMQGAAQIDDKNCATVCHTAAAIALYHTPLVAPNPANALNFDSATAGGAAAGTNGNTNASYVAAYTGNLPAGAHKPTWDLKSFSINASGNPVFVFRFLEDGLRKDFQAYTSFAATPTFWPGYVGGPSFYVAMGLSQDGITAPVDWNATASIYFPNAWRGDNKAATGAALGATAATTLTGPDAVVGANGGYYTLTMTGVKVPIDGTATMVTGGIGYTYGIPATQPLTQTDVPGYAYTPIAWTGTNLWTASGQGGVSVPAPNVTKLAAGVTSNAGRRAIVTNAKCNDCHAALGVFTEKVYHAGQRNDAPTCTFCHNVNRVNSGWGVNIKEAVHSIHATGKRVNLFSWEASAGDKYWNVTYPAVLNDCEACHVPGSYDFSASSNAAAVSNLLWTTTATGVTKKVGDTLSTADTRVITWVGAVDSISQGYDFTNPTGATAINVAIAPFITAGTTYGAGYGVAFSATAAPVITQAKATSLVSSPITSACAACHDTPVAIAHFRGNGGSFYAARPADGALPANVEQCMICHGNGKVADIRAVHITYK